MKANRLIISTLLLPLLYSCHDGSHGKNETRRYVLNNTDWKDNDNNPIIAHDGGISRFNGTWYWYGSNYSGNPTGVYGVKAFLGNLTKGVNVYSSDDLVNWTYRGIALAAPQELEGIKGKGSIHRPHVIFNEETGKYLMWFFYFRDTYPDIMATVAVSDNPEGPFSYVGEVETGSPEITGATAVIEEQRSEAPAGCSQDLNIFVDEDVSAYLVYDDGVRNIRVDKLSDDYLSSTGHTVIALPPSHEAPAMARYKGKYIVAGSGVMGWAPTPTHYAVADHPMGPYSQKKSLIPRIHLDTWNSQITSFIYIQESDRLIAMCDQWWIPDVHDINKSRYLWLEVIYHEDLNEFEMIYSDTVFINTN